MKSRTTYQLVGFSFLILFFELALIRFVPSSVRLVGYYTNFILVSTFLGMGIGLILEARGRHYPFLFPFLLLALVCLISYFSNVLVERPKDTDEILWLIVYEASPNVKQYGIHVVLALLFLSASLCFVPLGMGLGRAFRSFPPLHAYALDILGSLGGILSFFVLSHFSLHPKWWFLIGLMLFLIVAHQRVLKSVAALFGAVLCVLLFFQGHQDPHEVWSPYYRINYFPMAHRTVVNVNGSLHQVFFDFRADALRTEEVNRLVYEDFLRPYALVDDPGDVLIVGAGTGNDVVFALERGATSVDAVEIDPEIVRLGTEQNPNRPYLNPKGRVIVDDARSYFKTCERSYDLVVFGTLDSQALLSGMSSLRLDNYVYTLNSFLSAKALLKPGGTFIVYHMSPTSAIAAKIYHLLKSAFHRKPVVLFEPHHRLFNYTFIVGDRPANAAQDETHRNRLEETRADVPSDDWPYLYLSHHVIPKHYLQAVGLLFGIGCILLVAAAGREIVTHRDLPMFFLGAGFLLLETKSVTQMSLLFGSTWTVNVLVFAAILIMIFAANLAVMRMKKPHRNGMFCLAFSLIFLNYLLPVDVLLGLSVTRQWILGGLCVGAPIFAASLVFSTLFKDSERPVVSLGYNFLGAVFGGLLENVTMLIGIQKLHILVLLIYFCAFALSFRRR